MDFITWGSWVCAGVVLFCVGYLAASETEVSSYDRLDRHWEDLKRAEGQPKTWR